MKNYYRIFVIIILILLIFLSLIKIHLFFNLLPSSLKNEYWSFQRIRNKHKITEIRKLDKVYSKKVYYYSDSAKIVADLFEASSQKAKPGLILLHGSNVNGRKLPLIKALGKKFSDAGFQVLAIDIRGFGESSDPIFPYDENDFNYQIDIKNGINYLIKHTNVDTNRIFALGHSFGAGTLLTSIFKQNKIKKYVLFGPPRRLRERILKEGALDWNYWFIRFNKDMELNPPIDSILCRKVTSILDIENYSEQLNKHKHKPIFLIDSGLENDSDKLFLHQIYTKISSPKNYWTIPNTDHYLNIQKIFGKIFYIPTILDEFVQVVGDWLLDDN